MIILDGSAGTYTLSFQSKRQYACCLISTLICLSWRGGDKSAKKTRLQIESHSFMCIVEFHKLKQSLEEGCGRSHGILQYASPVLDVACLWHSAIRCERRGAPNGTPNLCIEEAQLPVPHGGI